MALRAQPQLRRRVQIRVARARARPGWRAVQRSIAQKSLDAIVKADPSRESVYGDQTVVTAGATVSF